MVFLDGDSHRASGFRLSAQRLSRAPDFGMRSQRLACGLRAFASSANPLVCAPQIEPFSFHRNSLAWRVSVKDSLARKWIIYTYRYTHTYHFTSALQSRSLRASSRDKTHVASAGSCGFRIRGLLERMLGASFASTHTYTIHLHTVHASPYVHIYVQMATPSPALRPGGLRLPFPSCRTPAPESFGLGADLAGSVFEWSVDFLCLKDCYSFFLLLRSSGPGPPKPPCKSAPEAQCLWAI